MNKFLTTLFFCLFSITTAYAQIDDRYFDSSRAYNVYKKKITRSTIQVVNRSNSEIIGGRPAGCPHRFCGCALSIKLFGRIIPHLNLAANWLKFPRAAPAPGMVAARPGHVFKLVAHVGGSTWRVWDANSGRGKIRVHNRSIAGYAIVNPGSG